MDELFNLKRALSVFLISFWLSFSPFSVAETLTTDATLQAGEHHFFEDLVVADGAKLTIEAGALITLADAVAIRIEEGGQLAVNGTASYPVIFTSDTYLEGAWAGLQFEGSRTNGDEIVIDNAIIEYADKALYTQGGGVKVTVTNSTVRYNNYGVYVDAYYQQPANHPVINFTSGALHDNVKYHYYTERFRGDAITTIDATGNWWGTSDINAIQASIYDVQDGGDKPLVDFSGLLTSQNGQALSGTHLMGPVSGRMEWRYDEALILDDILVTAGSELVIYEGSNLKFHSDVKITVEDGAMLSIFGTTGAPVTLTSSTSQKAAGDWQGIIVNSNGNVRLINSVIEYADVGVKFLGAGASGSIHNSTIQFNLTGIHVDGRYSSYDEHPNPTITNNIIKDNANYNYYTETFSQAGERSLNARGNYWGTSDSVAIAQSVYDNSDSSGSPIVDTGFQRFSPDQLLVADAGEDKVGFSSVETMLAGTVTSGSQNDTFAWEQTSGVNVQLRNAGEQVATFVSPDVEENEQATFVFTATDANGITAADSVNITIKPFSEYNLAPTVEPSKELVANANEPVSVQLSASDSDGDTLTFEWQQVVNLP